LQEWRQKRQGPQSDQALSEPAQHHSSDNTDFEDIKLEIAANRAIEEKGDNPLAFDVIRGEIPQRVLTGRQSTARKNSVQEHYKQFYGGGEDDVITSISQIKDDEKKKDLELGAFQGVYLPCVTNILSVVIFLRINYIVGEAGIFQAYVILFFSTATTFLTVLSMNAIATNGKIRTGGVYYMISRSLGPSNGGSIGILYYFATTFSSAMSILGAVEAMHVISGFSLGPIAFSMRFFSFIVLGVLAVINLFGVKFVSRTGTVLIFLVFISIFSMVIGLFASKSRSHDLQSRVKGLTGIDGSNFANNWG
jgi:hypothetical protein